MKLDFNKTVGSSSDLITDHDKKIDTSDVDTETKKEQNRFLNSLGDDQIDDDDNNSLNDDDIADTSSEDDEDDEESDDEEEDDTESKEAESDDEESDEDDSETEDESDQATDTDKEALADKGGKFGGYDTFEDYQLNVVKPLQDKAGSPSNDQANETADDFSVTVEFLKKHSDIIPESTIESYRKYGESQNDAFVYGDNHLTKLVKSIANINPNLPYTRRLELAYEIAFKDDLIKQAQKAAQAKTELRTQKVNKATASSTGSGNGKGSSKGSTLNTDQIKAFNRMGVKIPKEFR